MYLASVSLFMFIAPLASVITEAFVNKNHIPLVLLIGKWFVFWAIGVRLLTAGLRQIIKPELTAEGVFGIKNKASLPIVRELGFANTGIGIAGILSLWFTAWVPAIALVGGLFLLLDGLAHIFNKRNSEENIAMYSDLFIGLLMTVYLIGMIIE